MEIGSRNRRAFLWAVSATGLALVAARASADPSAPPASALPSSAPPPAAPPARAVPSPSASPKPPSDAALAAARTMRRFDAKLTDANIERIARDVDANGKAAEALNPHGRLLHNSDEPVTTFRVAT